MRVLAAPSRWPGGLRRAAKYLAGAGVTALFAWLFVRNVDFAEVWRTMRHANLLYLPAVCDLFLLSYWLQAWRWHHLVRHLNDVPTSAAFPRVLLAHSAGMLLPFQLGQVLMVQVSAEKFNLDRARLFGAEFISRLNDALVFAIFLLIGLLALRIGPSFTALACFMLAGSLAGFGLAFWSSHEHPHVLERSHLPFKAYIFKAHEQVLHPFLTGLNSIRNLDQTRDIMGISFLIWGVEGVFYWLAGLMLHLHEPLAVYFFLVAAANIGGGIPFAQSGAGFVYVAQQAFVSLGQRSGVATAYALTLQALLIMPIVVIAPYAIWKLHLTWADIVPWVKPWRQKPNAGAAPAEPRSKAEGRARKAG